MTVLFIVLVVIVAGCGSGAPEKQEATKTQAESAFRTKFVAALDKLTASPAEAAAARRAHGMGGPSEVTSRSHLVVSCRHENEWHCIGTAYAAPRADPVRAPICFLLDGGGYTDGNDKGFSAGPPGEGSGNELNPAATQCEEHKQGEG
jgi:hypothetical protein